MASSPKVEPDAKKEKTYKPMYISNDINTIKFALSKDGWGKKVRDKNGKETTDDSDVLEISDEDMKRLEKGLTRIDEKLDAETFNKAQQLLTELRRLRKSWDQPGARTKAQLVRKQLIKLFKDAGKKRRSQKHSKKVRAENKARKRDHDGGEIHDAGRESFIRRSQQQPMQRGMQQPMGGRPMQQAPQSARLAATGGLAMSTLPALLRLMTSNRPPPPPPAPIRPPAPVENREAPVDVGVQAPVAVDVAVGEAQDKTFSDYLSWRSLARGARTGLVNTVRRGAYAAVVGPAYAASETAAAGIDFLVDSMKKEIERVGENTVFDRVLLHPIGARVLGASNLALQASQGNWVGAAASIGHMLKRSPASLGILIGTGVFGHFAQSVGSGLWDATGQFMSDRWNQRSLTESMMKVIAKLAVSGAAGVVSEVYHTGMGAAQGAVAAASEIGSDALSGLVNTLPEVIPETARSLADTLGNAAYSLGSIFGPEPTEEHIADYYNIPRPEPITEIEPSMFETITDYARENPYTVAAATGAAALAGGMLGQKLFPSQLDELTLHKTHEPQKILKMIIDDKVTGRVPLVQGRKLVDWVRDYQSYHQKETFPSDIELRSYAKTGRWSMPFGLNKLPQEYGISDNAALNVLPRKGFKAVDKMFADDSEARTRFAKFNPMFQYRLANSDLIGVGSMYEMMLSSTIAKERNKMDQWLRWIGPETEKQLKQGIPLSEIRPTKNSLNEDPNKAVPTSDDLSRRSLPVAREPPSNIDLNRIKSTSKGLAKTIIESGGALALNYGSEMLPAYLSTPARILSGVMATQAAKTGYQTILEPTVERLTRTRPIRPAPEEYGRPEIDPQIQAERRRRYETGSLEDEYDEPEVYLDMLGDTALYMQGQGKEVIFDEPITAFKSGKERTNLLGLFQNLHIDDLDNNDRVFLIHRPAFDQHQLSEYIIQDVDLPRVLEKSGSGHGGINNPDAQYTLRRLEKINAQGKQGRRMWAGVLSRGLPLYVDGNHIRYGRMTLPSGPNKMIAGLLYPRAKTSWDVDLMRLFATTPLKARHINALWPSKTGYFIGGMYRPALLPMGSSGGMNKSALGRKSNETEFRFPGITNINMPGDIDDDGNDGVVPDVFNSSILPLVNTINRQEQRYPTGDFEFVANRWRSRRTGQFANRRDMQEWGLRSDGSYIPRDDADEDIIEEAAEEELEEAIEDENLGWEHEQR